MFYLHQFQCKFQVFISEGISAGDEEGGGWEMLENLVTGKGWGDQGVFQEFHVGVLVAYVAGQGDL